MYRLLVILLYFTGCGCSLFSPKQSNLNLQCRDLAGKPVDWFAAYKLPVLEDNPSHKNGLDFLYSDPHTPNWVVSPKNINDSASAIGLTLSQLWDIKTQPESFYALYNDEHPNKNSSDSYRGHMKGALAFDDDSGFWMIHSVPKFVDLNATGYQYAGSGTKNGQSILCITFPNSALTPIGTQLMIAQPSVYASNLPTRYATLFPDLAKAVGMQKFSGKDYSSIRTVQSLGNVEFTSFSKNKKYGKDLYQDLVAPGLKGSMFVETWLNGGGDLLSFCNSSYKIFNLRSVKVDTDFGFTNSKDHSKWAVSSDKADPFVCIGDINRQKSQMGRGGGTMCLKNLALWQLYRSSVDHVECCPTNRFHMPPADFTSINGSNSLLPNYFSYLLACFVVIFIDNK